MLHLRQLEAFRAVAVAGNVTAAARQLGVSQPAVSRLISSLSKRVGFDVFMRDGGRLVPTQEARFLLGEVDRVLAGLSNIEKLVEEIHELKVGHLRITCLPGFATTHLPKVIAEFMKERPGVTMAIEPDRPERILDWIISHQYDVGISSDHLKHPALETIPLMMKSVCVLPPNHRLKDREHITPMDLDNEPFIHARRDSDYFSLVKAAFDASGARLNPLIESRQFGLACRIVAGGVGVSVVSIIDALEYVDEGLILKPFKPVVPHKLSILYPTHTPRSVITMEFIDLFLKSLEPYRIQGSASTSY
ncbi:LysR substrate-binding domain-containing protein [uncultured Cohaesibacter sp.]|uniref:LysR family transcriptional regulator n=1 Tax=uncultured Cohaesibacter sp. TaxID=1002546 RepID=UPI00292F756F|nr:LysR substrate-binding domain-containing protein [uncultured Cohaesibacter sp.]